ncbi:E3 ubiquitin-protein ligase ZNF598-like [Panonychus citri]|uniref:E3 ubiquitin-protein ligase ZNF598-like n=1 Tax=Panonychus citri TaxID=50023 RepID=UPI0023082CA7|nr:E3 ubiquitin-protein ligase ZNF598-like [Panonychus citri]
MYGRQISRIGGRYGNSSSSSSSSSSSFCYSPMNKFGISCDVCCHSIPGEHRRAIFAIGSCDHPICYHCSTKMRVLCEQNECPICRQDVSEIIFTECSRKKFSDFDLSRFYFDDKSKIYFETQSCFDTFNSLLEEKCKRCNTTLESVNELQDHLWHKHRLLTCQVCVQNLKIFSEERKYYNSGQLEDHMKIGDPDDRSFQGHPACQLCDQRYVDSEELNRHLRRDHYFCHLCDSKVIYFNKYETLNQHFREKHFLCEEGPCKKEQFTSVFRTAIDLQAHKAQSHCLTKSEAKHARTLNLDFTFNTAPRGPRAGGFNSQVVATLNDDGLSNSRGGGSRRGRGGDRGDRGDRGDGNDRGNDRNPPNISEDFWIPDDLSSLGAAGPIQLSSEDYPSLGDISKQRPQDRSVAKLVANDVTNGQDLKACAKPKQKFSTKVKESGTFGNKEDEEFPTLCAPEPSSPLACAKRDGKKTKASKLSMKDVAQLIESKQF